MDGDYETVAVADQMDLRAKPARELPNAWSDGSCIFAVFGPPNCGRLLGFFSMRRQRAKSTAGTERIGHGGGPTRPQIFAVN